MRKRGLYAVLLLSWCSLALAQELNAPSFAARQAREHRFWDRENKALFLIHACLEGADFALTHRGLANGGREQNPLARPFTNLGMPGQVTFFAGGTAASLGISYLLHRSRHHRLERLVGMYAIADSSVGVIHNAMLPVHPSAPHLQGH